MGWLVIAGMTGSWAGASFLLLLPLLRILRSANFLTALGVLTRTLTRSSLTAWLFLAVSGTQMALWALKKHRNYKKVFGAEYPRGRKAMIPFIL